MIKTSFTVLFLLILGLAGCQSGPPADMYRVSPADLRILDQTKSFLSDENRWARGEETRCDVEAPQLTLFCALQKASFDVINDFHLRRPALEEVRYAIDNVSETALERRLIDFNNLETTDLSDIHMVIDMARERIEARLAAMSQPGN